MMTNSRYICAIKAYLLLHIFSGVSFADNQLFSVENGEVKMKSEALEESANDSIKLEAVRQLLIYKSNYAKIKNGEQNVNFVAPGMFVIIKLNVNRAGDLVSVSEPHGRIEAHINALAALLPMYSMELSDLPELEARLSQLLHGAVPVYSISKGLLNDENVFAQDVTFDVGWLTWVIIEKADFKYLGKLGNVDESGTRKLFGLVNDTWCEVRP